MSAEKLYYQTPACPEPLVYEVPLMPEDAFTRAQANRFIGSVALGAAVEAPAVLLEQTASPIFANLMEAVHAASMGDDVAICMIQANAETHLSETMDKVGPAKPIERTIEADGISQFGQTDLQIQANSLRYADGDTVMLARLQAETRNAFRIKNLTQQGLLATHSLVVVSRPEDKPEFGFFTDTMSIAIQLTTATEGRVITSSAFVAGKALPSAETQDAAIAAHLGAQFGVDYEAKDPAEIIDTPILIHNSLLPNGVLDLAAICDELSGTFYGEARPVEDYTAHQQACFARQDSFRPRVERVTQQLIAEAASIQTPLQATERLHKLSEGQLVEVAVNDATINPLVLGQVAARHIEMARLHLENGDIAEVVKSTQSAVSTAKSSSCPNGVRSSATGEDSTPQGDSETKPTGKKERMKCPFCGDKNQSGDPCSPNQHCNNCDARVSNGRVVSKGNGGKKPPKPLPTPPKEEPVAPVIPIRTRESAPAQKLVAA